MVLAITLLIYPTTNNMVTLDWFLLSAIVVISIVIGMVIGIKSIKL